VIMSQSERNSSQFKRFLKCTPSERKHQTNWKG
jgi:hypothetical protein